jgi:hypothetical protein
MATLDAGIRQGEVELAWLRATRASVAGIEES